MKGELYPARQIFHRSMGPPDSCEVCYGRGWRVELEPDGDYREVYCDCPCGDARRVVDGAEPRSTPETP